ncbi:MAG: ABC transporter ATP-binding protein [Nannocystis sp.]|nr:ABC transporter ATP-binding protein [Nannocystis sp.]MBA3548244.1 ABC transporter ATP-binding protein [Nannocystis sp.]
MIAPPPAVEVENLGKVYGSGATAFTALRDINLRVEPGEFIMLEGPSGSGKTTLLSILGCVLTPTRGEVKLFGESISGRPESQLPELRLGYIGFVFQGHNLVASLTARQNIMLVLQLRGWSVRAASQEAEMLLEQVGLPGKTESKPRDLSGGQRQRVAIARALAGGPPLILADEPTAALDAENGLKVTEILRQLARQHGRTVLVVTHDNRIFHLADRILHIEDGLMREAPQHAAQ